MTNAGLKAAAIAASSLILLGVSPVVAGADAIRAEAYFNAISGGNADTITSFYADDAEFHWVGGPLAGVYQGKDKIRGVWDRFTKAAGDIDHEVLQLSESANGKTSTVTARVKFKGAGEVPVKFIMVYKDGKIASEVWQVDKTGATYAKADDKPDAKPEPKTAEVRAEARNSTPVPPLPAAKPAQASAIAAVYTPAARPSTPPAATERKLAAAPDQPPADLDGEPEDAAAGYLPVGGRAPKADAAEIATSPTPAGKRAEIAPEKDFKAEPKLKAPVEKKSGYSEKFEERKTSMTKRYDSYGHGWRGHGGYSGGGYSGYSGGGYSGYSSGGDGCSK